MSEWMETINKKKERQERRDVTRDGGQHEMREKNVTSLRHTVPSAAEIQDQQKLG